MPDDTQVGAAKNAPHLRSLISRLHPGKSVRQVARAAGDPGRLEYYLKPTTVIDAMPRNTAMKEIARILGCDFEAVVQAFAADVGLPWGGMGEEDRRALRQLGEPGAQRSVDINSRLSEEDRRTWHRMGEALGGGPLP